MMKTIVVIYLDIRGIKRDEINNYIQEIYQRLNTDSEAQNILHYIVPVKRESSVECINPTIITRGVWLSRYRNLINSIEKIINQDTKNNERSINNSQ